MPFEKANNILSQRLGKHNLLRQTQSALVCYEADKIIQAILDDKKIQVGSFKNGALVINVPDTSRASEVQLKKDQIKQKLNQKLKKDLIKSIRTRVR